jgi:hypothetical protein
MVVMLLLPVKTLAAEEMTNPCWAQLQTGFTLMTQHACFVAPLSICLPVIGTTGLV